jgi:hypothetical protein
MALEEQRLAAVIVAVALAATAGAFMRILSSMRTWPRVRSVAPIVKLSWLSASLQLGARAPEAWPHHLKGRFYCASALCGAWMFSSAQRRS